MQKSNFDTLMQRYLEGTASEQERTKLEAWLDTMKTKNTGGIELSKEDEERLFQKITSKTANVEEVVSIVPKQTKTITIHWAWQIAAAVVLFMAVFYAAWNYIDNNNKEQNTATNGIEKLILNDGTLVWLHKGSSLSYFEKQDGTRNTNFQGEALFEVAKDANHPFIIRYGDMQLKVLGTSFNLKATDNNIQVIVLTGKVNLSTTTDQEGINIEPNQKAICANGKMEKLSLAQSEVSTATANTEYNMQFNDMALSEVAKKISKKFNVEITIANEQAGQCGITGDFTDRSLEYSLQLITEILDVHYSQNGNVITITGNGCK